MTKRQQARLQRIIATVDQLRSELNDTREINPLIVAIKHLLQAATALGGRTDGRTD